MRRAYVYSTVLKVKQLKPQETLKLLLRNINTHNAQKICCQSISEALNYCIFDPGGKRRAAWNLSLRPCLQLKCKHFSSINIIWNTFLHTLTRLLPWFSGPKFSLKTKWSDRIKRTQLDFIASPSRLPSCIFVSFCYPWRLARGFVAATES